MSYPTRTRLLLVGSVPPEWGGATSGGVATVHRILIEEILARGAEHGLEIAGLLPPNLDPSTRLRPPVPIVERPAGPPDPEVYRRAVSTTRPDLVLFQHIAHNWAVYHRRNHQATPALGVVHSWHSLMSAEPDRVARIRRVTDEALRGLAGVVFVSAQTRTEGSQLGFQYPFPATVIHNPLGADFARRLPADDHPRSGWLFVGSLIPRKNPLALLAAATRCGQPVAFVGDGPLADELRSTATRLGMADRVTFAGQAAAPEIREHMLRADLLCVPSSSEGFSMAYLEALACGTPVVGAGANVTELADRLGMTCGAPIWHGTADEIEERAGWVQSRTWDRRALHQRTVETFSPGATVAEYAAAIRTVLSGRPDRTTG